MLLSSKNSMHDCVILEALWISRFSFFLSILAGFEYSLRSFAHQFTTIHKQPLWGPEIACSKIYRVHAAVSIRRMYVMKTLIASTNSLHWSKNTEQTARKFAGVNEPLQRTLGTLGVRPLPTPHPLGVPFSMKLKFVKTVQTQTIWVQWLLSSKCNDCWNLFLIKLMLF